jgi:hypothetical protein
MESRSLYPAPRPNKGAPRSFICDGGFRSLENKGLRPLFTLAAPPMPPPRRAFCEMKKVRCIARDQIERPCFRFAERKCGGLGAEKKTQSEGRSPDDCQSFFRAPIENQTHRGAPLLGRGAARNPPRACSIRNLAIHRVRFQLDCVEITGLCFKMLRFHSLGPHSI